MILQFRAFSAAHDWAWCQQQVGIIRCEDTSGVMAIDTETNETVGACILDNWTQTSVQAHFMLTDTIVLRHGFIEGVFDCVFNHFGKKTMYGLVPANNEKALKLNKHMGFTEKVRLEEAYGEGIDYVVMELKRENCKYLPKVEAA